SMRRFSIAPSFSAGTAIASGSPWPGGLDSRIVGIPTGALPMAKRGGTSAELPTGPAATCDEMLRTWRGATEIRSAKQDGRETSSTIRLAGIKDNLQIFWKGRCDSQNSATD